MVKIYHITTLREKKHNILNTNLTIFRKTTPQCLKEMFLKVYIVWLFYSFITILVIITILYISVSGICDREHSSRYLLGPQKATLLICSFIPIFLVDWPQITNCLYILCYFEMMWNLVNSVSNRRMVNKKNRKMLRRRRGMKEKWMRWC